MSVGSPDRNGTSGVRQTTFFIPSDAARISDSSGRFVMGAFYRSRNLLLDGRPGSSKIAREQSPEAICFYAAQVSNFAPLEDLTALETLYLEGTAIVSNAHRPNPCVVG